jgi:hypothetical protein
MSTDWRNNAVKLNVNSIRQRLQKLEQYIDELEKQQPITLTTFRNDFTRQLAVERAFQAAVESCTDIAAHIRLTASLPPRKRLLAGMQAQAFARATVRGALRRRYPNLSQAELNMKVLAHLTTVRMDESWGENDERATENQVLKLGT